MATNILQKNGTQIVFADHAGDFSPSGQYDLRVGSPTNVQLSLASVTNTSARQSAKVDLGSTRAPAYMVMGAFEFGMGVVPAETVEVYWSPSPQSGLNNANCGGTGGRDAAYSGTVGVGNNLSVAVRQLVYIGSHICTGDPTPSGQIGFIGVLQPQERYGSLVVKNESDATMHTNDRQMHIIFNPIIDEIQN